MTRSPELNQILDLARRHAAADLAARSSPDLSAALDGAERMLGQMRQIFEAQLRFRERTPVLTAQLPAVRAAFARVQTGLAAVRAQQYTSGADDLEHGFNALMNAMDTLKAEEDTWPVQSRSSFMNVLMRLAHGVARGGIAPDALGQGLSEMLAHLRRTASDLDEAPRQGRDAEQYAARRTEIRTLARTIEQGLMDAQQQLSAGAVKGIPQTLQRTCAAADALAEIQASFQQTAEQAQSRPCLRCGASNPRAHRHCGKCQALLPPVPVDDEAPSAVDVTLEEGQARARGHARTELSVKLEEAAHAVRAGQLSHDGFARVLDEAQTRLAKARQQLDALQMPPDVTPEARETGETAAAAMRTAFDQFAEGLERMRTFPLDGNLGTLEHGLEAVLTAGDTLAAFQRLSQTAS